MQVGAENEKPKELQPNPPGGVDGFRSIEEKDWHRKYFANRGISIERAIDLAYTGEMPYYLEAILRYPGWNQAFSILGECNMTVARLFTASLIKREQYSFTAYVRGREVHLTPTTVASILGIQQVPNCEFPYPPGATVPSYSEIALVLSGTHMEWNGMRFDSNKLLEHYKPLQLLLYGTLFPNMTKQFINLFYARFLHAIITEKRICLARCLIDFISYPSHSVKKQNFIKCGILITKLCYGAGVERYPNDQMGKIQGKIGEKTINRREGQRKKRRVGEGTSAAAAVDEEEEPFIPSHTDPTMPPPPSVPPFVASSDMAAYFQRVFDGQEEILRTLARNHKRVDTRLEGIEEDVASLKEAFRRFTTTSSSSQPHTSFVRPHPAGPVHISDGSDDDDDDDDDGDDGEEGGDDDDDDDEEESLSVAF